MEENNDNQEIHYVFEDAEFVTQPDTLDGTLSYKNVVYSDSTVYLHEGNYYIPSNSLVFQDGAEESPIPKFILSSSKDDTIQTDMEPISDETNEIAYEYANIDSNDSTENVIYELETDENGVDSNTIVEGYQFAFIKDGKLILQETPTNESELEYVEEITTETVDNNVKIVDISQVVGRNMITGQPVTLSSYFDKVSKSDYSDILNKKIELGVNSKGKKLFGKILEIQKSVNIQRSEIETKPKVALPILDNNQYNLVKTTLLGLMDMNSIKDKLSDKPIYVKLVENVAHNVNSVKLITGCLYRIYGEEEGLVFIIFNMDREEEVEYQEEALRRELMFKYRYVCPMGLTVTISTDKIGQQATGVILNPASKHLYTCIICNKQMKNIKALHRHFSSFHTDFNKTSTATTTPPTKTAGFVCYTCDRRFKTRSSMKRHQVVHNPELRIYECTICKQRYSDNSALRKHLVTHTGLKPHVCDVCGRAFTISGHLTAHKRTHLMQGTHLFTCETCGRTFSRQSNLHRHAQIHAQGLFECHICQCTYQHSSSLTRHMIQVHVFAGTDDLNEDPVDS